MRQKIGFTIAFAKEAKVLLLDEPISGLDPKTGIGNGTTTKNKFNLSIT